jgi:hypothetical protein
LSTADENLLPLKHQSENPNRSLACDFAVVIENSGQKTLWRQLGIAHHAE